MGTVFSGILTVPLVLEPEKPEGHSKDQRTPSPVERKTTTQNLSAIKDTDRENNLINIYSQMK